MPENKATRSSIGYEARIAMFIGFCALCVAGYTAYMQRQQVRAQVWPILEFDSSNGPIHFTLANKGVGPAIIKHAIVKVDGEPVRDWTAVLDKLLGPPTNPEHKRHYSESDMNSHVLSGNESMDIMTPEDDDNKPIAFDRENPLWKKLNDVRFKVTVEICYCSTLGECWTLHGGGSAPSTTTECRSCPTPSAISFQQ